MMCEKCLSRPASIHLTKIINGNKTQVKLCSQCASQGEDIGMPMNFNLNLQDFISGMLNLEATQALKCNKCGLEYSQFSKNGRLGCNECYKVFEQKVNPMLNKIHKSSSHLGKIPKRSGGKIRVLKLVKDLKDELQNVIQLEEFERAAEIRDKIRELEKTSSEGGN